MIDRTVRSVDGVFRYIIERSEKRLDLLLKSARNAIQPLAEPGKSVPLELEAVEVAEHVAEGEILVQVRGELFADDAGPDAGLVRSSCRSRARSIRARAGSAPVCAAPRVPRRAEPRSSQARDGSPSSPHPGSRHGASYSTTPVVVISCRDAAGMSCRDFTSRGYFASALNIPPSRLCHACQP